MTPTDARAAGAALAEWHASGLDRTAVPERRLWEVSELPQLHGWTLRSALVRYAQPRPGQAGAVLELVRRTEGALHPHHRLLDSTMVVADHAASPDRLVEGDYRPSDKLVQDARASDIARLAGSDPNVLDAVVDGYSTVTELDPDEVRAAALLTAAVVLDELAASLARWADDRKLERPDLAVDTLGRTAFTILERLDVERETRPPRRA